MQIDHYAVFGNPIAHSLSPFIHNIFAKNHQQAIDYRAILAPKEGFFCTLEIFFAQGGKGCNITAPFKEEAYRFCTLHTERAHKAQAVNTIKLTHEGLLGDNTDGAGLLTDLQNYLDLTGKRILIIGAGGATRGILLPILKAKPASMVIANRTIERAQSLCEHFKNEEIAPSAIPLSQLDTQKVDILIHASSDKTPSSLMIPPSLWENISMAYDLNYGLALSPFLQQAKSASVPIVLDGLGMLIHQAAEAFYLWRGIYPETHQLLPLLRAQLFQRSQ